MDELKTVQPQAVENTSVGASANEVNENPIESNAAAYAEAIQADMPTNERVKVDSKAEKVVLQAEREQLTECPMSKIKTPVKRICEVCGHVNKGNSLICEMCSNYLFD